jgi:hypothetical protein
MCPKYFPFDDEMTADNTFERSHGLTASQARPHRRLPKAQLWCGGLA